MRNICGGSLCRSRCSARTGDVHNFEMDVVAACEGLEVLEEKFQHFGLETIPTSLWPLKGNAKPGAKSYTLEASCGSKMSLIMGKSTITFSTIKSHTENHH